MARHRVGSDLRWGARPFPFWKVFRDDLGVLGLVSAGSVGLGLMVNGLRAHPLALGYAPPEARLGRIVARMPEARPPAATPGDLQTISLDEFQEMVAEHKGVSIDARPRALYEAGHVPGALSLPREDFEKSYAGIRASLGASGGQPVVIYCAEADCRDSELVAEALGRLGFRNLQIYREGWEEWRRAGLPQETANPPD